MRLNQLNVPATGKSPRTGVIFWQSLLATVVLSLVALASWSVAFDEEANSDKPAESTGPAPEPGLQGMLPFFIPNDLATDQWDRLDGNWADWSAGVAKSVTDFYESDSLNAKTYREALVDFERKLEVMETALKDERYRKLHDPLGDLHGKLSRRVAVLKAALDTLELDPAAARDAKIVGALKNVGKELASLRATLADISGGSAWLPFVYADDIQKAVDAGAVPAATPEAFTKAAKKLGAKDKLENKSQREFLDAHFGGLEKAIQDYLAAEKTEVTDTSGLRDNLTTLIDAIETYEAERTSAAAGDVRKTLGAVKKSAPDGGELIADALQENYLNYNLKIVASESFLNKIVKEERVDSGEVVDYILGANVYGHQTTNTTVGLDLVPNNSKAAFALTLTGVSRSNTSGTTSQATVYTSGYHRFWARKPMTFDGTHLGIQDATIRVDANNTTTGADTGFGGLGNNIAMRRANEKRPQSEAIARQRVSSRVLPEFNKSVNAEFKNADAEFKKRVIDPLKELEIFPQAYDYRTRDDELRVSTRLMVDGELGGSWPSPGVTTENGIAIHLHESVMNNALDRLKLGGRELTETELAAEIEKMISTLIGKDFSFPEPKKEENSDEEENGKEPPTFVFEKDDPIRISARGGELAITLRIGIKQPGEEDIPAQIITVPLTFNLAGDNITVQNDQIEVAPVDRPKSVATQIVRAGVVRKKIGGSIPSKPLKRSFDVKLDKKRQLKLSVAQIKPLGGWLSIVIE